jgi:hypothetical protein
MKKFYSTFLGLLITGTGVLAQTKTQLPLEFRYKPTLDRTTASGAERGDGIWCDDFSDASTWEVGTLNGVTDNWVIGTAVPDGDFPIDGIASTTAANGYALFDSDLYCNTEDNAYVQMVTPVDLQGIPNVVLRFEQYYRAFQGECWVDVSIDGSTWTEFQVNTDIAVNAATPNPEVFELNISSVAGNQSSVWVRFRYTGACDYAWMVDDVCMVEQVPVDLVMLDGFLTSTGVGEEYGRIPAAQFYENMLVGGTFVNNGSSTLTNVTATMELRNEANAVVATATTTVASLAPGATAALEQEIATSNFSTEGVYTATFTAACAESGQDANTANDVYLRAFEVTDAKYSLDGVGIHPPGYESLNSLGSNSFTGAEDGLNVMTYYEMPAAQEVYGIEVELAFGTEVGGFVVVNILDTADVFAATPNLSNPVAESAAYDLTDADLTTGVLRIPFDNVVNLVPGGYYANVILNSNAGAGHIRVLDDQTVPQPGGGSLIFIPGDDLYTNGVASCVRMITQPLNIGVSENNTLVGVSVFPNPSNGVVNIRTAELEVYNVEVVNVTGKLVRTERINGTSTMDLSDLAKGVYTVRVSNANGIMTQRVTLQ